MNIRFMAAIAVTAVSQFLAGCGGGGGIGGTGSSAQGTMHLSITDAPSCGYDAVNVTIEKVRVHKSSSAVDADGGWSQVVLNPAKRVDLLTLTNGVLEDLGQTALPTGKYTQMRLVLAPNSGGSTLANSVVPTGGAETALTTPSGQQTGIKLNVDIDIAADKVADFVLDFDACKSVVRRGNSGQFNLKPVVTVIPVLSDAGMRVVGYVDPSIAATTTNVSVQFNGLPVKATTPDVTGKFVLYPVPAGNYDLVVTSAGHVTAVMTGVPVLTTTYTYVNSAAVPIAPSPITTLPALRPVSGTVTPATATVRALQTFTAGPTVEIAFGAVDATSGAFAFALPIEGPVKTAYVANPLSLIFTPDATAAGKYTLQAALGIATLSQAIDTTAAVLPVTFTFP
jgi:hypothetical protein